MKPETVVSNYPRGVELSQISPAQAKATLVLVRALDHVVTATLVAVVGTAIIFANIVGSFGIPAGAVILCTCIVLWTLYYRDVKSEICAYAAVAGWSPARIRFACAAVYLCILLVPGLVGMTLVNSWICKDLERFGIRCRGGYVPKEILKRIGEVHVVGA